MTTGENHTLSDEVRVSLIQNIFHAEDSVILLSFYFAFCIIVIFMAKSRGTISNFNISAYTYMPVINTRKGRGKRRPRLKFYFNGTIKIGIIFRKLRAVEVNSENCR